jgi:hypothetical protein
LKKNREIFKTYRHFFLKSEDRRQVLDEKFQKDMDKGYVSKTNIEEYNQYFSNFVSN